MLLEGQKSIQGMLENTTAQKLKYSLMENFIYFVADLFTITEEILNGKLHFLYNVQLTLKKL